MTISLTLGNTGLPAGHRPAGYQHLFRQLFLGEALFGPQGPEEGPDLFLIHDAVSFHVQHTARRPFRQGHRPGDASPAAGHPVSGRAKGPGAPPAGELPPHAAEGGLLETVPPPCSQHRGTPPAGTAPNGGGGAAAGGLPLGAGGRVYSRSPLMSLMRERMMLQLQLTTPGSGSITSRISRSISSLEAATAWTCSLSLPVTR